MSRGICEMMLWEHVREGNTVSTAALFTSLLMLPSILLHSLMWIEIKQCWNALIHYHSHHLCHWPQLFLLYSSSSLFFSICFFFQHQISSWSLILLYLSVCEYYQHTSSLSLSIYISSSTLLLPSPISLLSLSDVLSCSIRCKCCVSWVIGGITLIIIISWPFN